MESVYIETSVVSYLVARPNRDPVTAWRQQLTNEWWVVRRGQFACVISQEVIAEALEGDAVMAAKRIEALRDLPLIASSTESAKLAADLLERGLFPANARADANHLAVATCAAVDYLLTGITGIWPMHKCCANWRIIWAGADCICPGVARRKNLWEHRTMKVDPILEEVWRIKDKLSREMVANPTAYFAKLAAIANAEKQAGRRVFRSAAELRQYVAQRERQLAGESALMLNDKLPGNQE